MTHHGLIIAAGGLAALVVVGLALRRRRERLQRLMLAARHAWELPTQSNWELLKRIDDIALTQVGHGRRINAAYRTRGRTIVFAYEFETGFEQRRRLHSWLVVVQEVDHGRSRATITTHEWVIAVVRGSACHEVQLSSVANSATEAAKATVIVEDPELWKPALTGPLGCWLAEQPQDRTWEILPNLVVGYQPGTIQVDELEALTAAAGELAKQLRS